MKTKNYESESVLRNIVIGIILILAVFAGYTLFTANPGEMVRQMQENREAASWNKEVAELIDNGDMDEAVNMAQSSFYELTEENASAIQTWEEKAAQEEQFIANALGEIRDLYLESDKELATENLFSLGRTYPESAYVKAYMELLQSVEKILTEEDMYDWKYGGKPGYGTYKDYRGNAVTGFSFSSYYTSNGEYGCLDTTSYTQITIDAACIAMGSETLPITVTDMNTGKAYTVYCPKGSISETLETSGGNVQISTPDDSIYAYGSAVVVITVAKELTEADFASVDVRFL